MQLAACKYTSLQYYVQRFKHSIFSIQTLTCNIQLRLEVSRFPNTAGPFNSKTHTHTRLIQTKEKRVPGPDESRISLISASKR